MSEELAAATGVIVAMSKDRDDVIGEPAWKLLGAHFALTPRQLAIAKLVCEARDNKDIAAHLTLSTETVRMHLREVYRKVSVESRVQLLLTMIRAARRLSGEQGPGAAGNPQEED